MLMLISMFQYKIIRQFYLTFLQNYTTMLSYIFSFSTSDYPWPTYPSAVHCGVAGVGGPVWAAVRPV